MCNKNEDPERADAIRYQFTAYLKKAVEHKRRDYIERERRYKTQIALTDFQDAAVLSTIGKNYALCAEISDVEAESERLENALTRLNSRETQILYARVVRGDDFKRIAKRLGISVNGAYSAYHRITVKLRKVLGGQEDAL